MNELSNLFYDDLFMIDSKKRSRDDDDNNNVSNKKVNVLPRPVAAVCTVINDNKQHQH